MVRLSTCDDSLEIGRFREWVLCTLFLENVRHLLKLGRVPAIAFMAAARNVGTVLRGWARSAAGDTAEGIPWIEQGIRDFRATGSALGLPTHLARKAEALHLADRTSEALETINEAEALAERFEQRDRCAELHRLRGVFLATLGGDETKIEASFCEAIRIAKEQKAISLAKRAEATYAE